MPCIAGATEISSWLRAHSEEGTHQGLELESNVLKTGLSF